MDVVNIWDLGLKIGIRPRKIFLNNLNGVIRKKFKSKERLYNIIKNKITEPLGCFKNFLKPSYYTHNKHAPLEVFLHVCESIGIERQKLQENIISYKTRKGYSIIENPILPIIINPYFDMVLAHNIADGTVIDPKRGRQIYFGYRQFDKKIRLLYVKKLESIFGEIKFKTNYFYHTTRPYCPSVVSQLFFKYYGLNSRSFLSKGARIPVEILGKNNDHLLAVLIAFIIDEGNIDSTLICIKLKNVELTRDLFIICQRLGYSTTFNFKGEYGNLYILREGMKKFYEDYKKIVEKYPFMDMGKQRDKIDRGLKIKDRTIYKTKGNRDLILKMIKKEDLTSLIGS